MLLRVRARMPLHQAARTLHILLKVIRSPALLVFRPRVRLPKTVLLAVLPRTLVHLCHRVQYHHTSPSLLLRPSQARHLRRARYHRLSMSRLTSLLVILPIPIMMLFATLRCSGAST